MLKYVRLGIFVFFLFLAVIPMGWSAQNSKLDAVEYNHNLFKNTYTQVNASHILVKSEKEAIDIKKQIDNGASFEEMARKYSLCPSGARGGNLGYFGRGVMVPEFEKAAFDLPKGKVSHPVKTQFGYHLIKVIDKK